MRLWSRVSFLVLLALVSSEAQGVNLIEEPRRVELDGFIENLSVIRLEAGAPAQAPWGRLELDFSAGLAERLRLVVGARVLAGGAVRRPRGAAVLDFSRVFQTRSPTVEFSQAYLELSRNLFDLRLGLQKFAWGRLDGTQPADLLNPESYVEPILLGEDERKIGVPAVTLDLFPQTRAEGDMLSELRLTLVWVPVHVPFRFPRGSERWYPPAGQPPEQAGVLFWFLREHNAKPARGLREGNLGLRLAGLSYGIDWAVYFYEGYDPQANFKITNTVKDAGLGELFVDLIPDFRRIRAVGADCEYGRDEGTLRLEAVFFSRRGYPMAVRSIVERLGRGGGDFLSKFIRGETVSVFPQREAVEWGFGGDYQLGRVWTLVQFNQIVLLNNDTKLMLQNIDSMLLANLRRSLLNERLELSLLGVYFIESEAFMIHPRVTSWLSDGVEARIGVLAIGGARRSLLGQFTHNDELYLQVRYHF